MKGFSRFHFLHRATSHAALRIKGLNDDPVKALKEAELSMDVATKPRLWAARRNV